MTYKVWWVQSLLVSTVLLVTLFFSWKYMHASLEHVEHPVTQAQDVQQMLDRYPYADSLIRIPTGVFIQSIKYHSASEVHISGYIWQRYAKSLIAENPSLLPEFGEVGFVLPEQVNSGSDITPREAYRIDQGDHWVVGWYVEAMLRQNFTYSTYPFDHKTVWLKLWSKRFSDRVVLVPDFSAYEGGGKDAIFGLEKNIVLGTWLKERTYFDYHFSDVDTNFGVEDFHGMHGFPKLRFNVVLKRKFQNAFVIYLLPLFLVSVLLFSTLLTVSGDELLSQKFGFNTSGFLGACSALFFVVMLAHIQLRERFSGEGIVYIEYFYILMYVMIVVSTANAYLFAAGSRIFGGLVLYRDNLIPKVIYWPCVLLTMLAITAVYL